MAAALTGYEDHREAVQEVSRKVKDFHAAEIPFRIYHGSTNSTRTSPFREGNFVNISKMNSVLGVDPERRLVYAQPNVPMDVLVEHTLQHDLLPPVVMEFPGITVGGGFSGSSGESSSFRYGLFYRTVEEVEMVLGNGEVVTASDTTRSDLFHGAACSFGTLGIVTLLTIRLIPAQSNVELTYLKVDSMEQAMETVKLVQEQQDLHYLDAMFFARDRGVLCLGKLVSNIDADAKVTRYFRPRDQWFYINAENRSIKERSWTEIIPIRDYLFRYDRGAFWMGKYTYRYFAVPFNRVSRWLLDQYSRTRLMYHALHRSDLAREYVVQDVAVPYSKASNFFDYLDQNFKQYPIWLCPLRVGGDSNGTTQGLLADSASTSPTEDMMMSFGIWGQGSTDPAQAIAWNKALESEIQACGGQKWLYAHTFYTEEQFWHIFDRRGRDQLRAKYHASKLPNLYEKVKPVDKYDERLPFDKETWIGKALHSVWDVWPVKGLYGWLQCIVAAEYLLPTAASRPAPPEISREAHRRDSAHGGSDAFASSGEHSIKQD
ncbi:Delta(24)-sterol reductase [Cercospora beticola]|uniref:Delta(24)-sterol reductase n=1 Tax=Cercospora beticola TaxID=122368 RepID=A0A2G5IAW8_CERBT|nr:Delta(24)-sterol reductase [Cercospora beticola]PIB01948.1 Delta(24)-sterol reductase [Cercospora beticola]WPA96969.1 hypothetical protein RHO25_001577 [Cercospora beticola]CAK1354641.1 unnamed protein product [Cercospora beticola]